MCEGKRVFKVRKGEDTIQNSHKKEKGVTSWESKQANKINKTIKESKADSTGNGKGKGKIHFLVYGRGRGLQRIEGKAQREEQMERVISIPETAKREASNRNNASEPEKSITFLRQIHFPKSQGE